MVRVKRGLMTRKRHKNLIKQTKGFRMARSHVFTLAKNALMKSGTNAYIGRKRKKRDFRRLWNTRISIALESYGINYSTFINKLYKSKVILNRKILSNLSISHPEVFGHIVTAVK